MVIGIFQAGAEAGTNFLQIFPVDLEAIHEYLTRAFYKTRHRKKQRRFTGTVGAYQYYLLPMLDAELYIAKGRCAVGITVRKIFYLNRFFHK